MKKQSLIVICILFSMPVLQVYAQGWTLLSPFPTYHDFGAVCFPSVDTGYAGTETALFKTTNGGESWMNMPGLSGGADKCIHFLDNNYGYVATSDGVSRTLDGGVAWDFKRIKYGVTINDVWFLNHSTGYACGWAGLLARTTDAGESWQVLSYPPLNNFYLTSVQFADTMTGFALGNNFQMETSLRRSDDGGFTWNEVQVPDEVEEVGSFYILGPDDIWIGAGNAFLVDTSASWGYHAKMFHSTDGGVTWEAKDIGMASSTSYAVSDIRFFNDQDARVMGYKTLYKTNDGGETWIDTSLWAINSNYFSLNQFSWPDVNTGYFAGDGPLLVRTGDAGLSFENLIDGETNQFRQIYFSDSLNGCIGGNNSYEVVLSYTTDGGYTWADAVIDSAYANLYRMQFANANLGWATCDYDLIRTTDGGRNWVTVPTGFTGWYGQLCVADENSLFLKGENFNILKSTNAGITWVAISPGISTQDYKYISYQFTDSLTGYIALEEKITGQGKLLKTADGGMTWTMADYGHYGLITAMNFYDSLHGVVHIIDNIIFVTRNGGETWTVADSDPEYRIVSVRITDAETVVATDRMGSHLVSYDGGSTFSVLYSGEATDYSYFSYSYYLNDLIGWRCGNGGMIKRFDLITSGVKDITPPLENISETLFWPNPSKNVIHMRKAGFENLSIYSIEGKLVYYQRHDRIMDIDISQLPSGIYILTLYQQGKRNQEKLIIQ